MARGSFGGGTADYAEDATGARVVGVAVAMYLVQTGGAQVTDLLVNGVAATAVTSGTRGYLPVFQGPNGIIELWSDAGGGGRSRLDAYADQIPVGVTLRLLYNGTNWLDATGLIATNLNRPAGTYRTFIGGPDANAAGLMIDGDDQITAV